VPDQPPPSTEPSPAETSGLRGARLAARVRQALYHLPAAELAAAHERMRQGAIERHMDYFHDGRVETIRVLPCPITLLPEQVAYRLSIGQNGAFNFGSLESVWCPGRLRPTGEDFGVEGLQAVRLDLDRQSEEFAFFKWYCEDWKLAGGQGGLSREPLAAAG